MLVAWITTLATVLAANEWTCQQQGRLPRTGRNLSTQNSPLTLRGISAMCTISFPTLFRNKQQTKQQSQPLRNLGVSLEGLAGAELTIRGPL